MARAVIYTRVSSREQVDGWSIEFQEEDCCKLCDAEGHQVVAAIRDIGERDELDERQGLNQVRQMFARGQADVLVVWRYDRLSGDPVQQSVLVYEIERKAGGKIRSTRETLEDGPVGELIRYVMGFGANMEIQAIRERIRRGKEARVAQGHLLASNHELYGYSWVDESKAAYVPNPLTAPIVRRIFQEFADGVPRRVIARRLNAEGVPGPRGGVWRHAAIQRMLTNPAYWGQPEAFRSRVKKVAKVDEFTGETKHIIKRGPFGEPVLLPADACPALVSPEVVGRVRQLLDLPTVRNNDPYLLRSGFIFCARCEKPFQAHHGPRRRPKYRHFECGGRVDADSLDSLVWHAAQVWVRHPEILEAAIRQRMSEQRSPKDHQIEALEHVVRVAKNRAARLLSAIESAAGGDEEELDPIMGLYRTAQRQAKEAQDRLEALKEQETTWQQFRDGVDASARRCREIVENDQCSLADKRQVLYVIGLRVTVQRVGTGQCDVELSLDPGGSVVCRAGATHLFEEPGALDVVARLACAWFQRYLVPEAGPGDAHMAP